MTRQDDPASVADRVLARLRKRTARCGMTPHDPTPGEVREEVRLLVHAERRRAARLVRQLIQRSVKDPQPTMRKLYAYQVNGLCNVTTRAILGTRPRKGKSHDVDVGEPDAAAFPIDGREPRLSDVAAAFIYGAREARANPQATEHHFERAADAYVKLWLQRGEGADLPADAAGLVAVPRDALEDVLYGHTLDCAFIGNLPGNECTCGYEQSAKALRATLGEP
jgi:hypothetical protein